MQPWYVSHAETIAQNVVGQVLAFFILWAYGIDTATGLWLQLTFLIVAYARGYAIRRAFEYWGRRHNRSPLNSESST